MFTHGISTYFIISHFARKILDIITFLVMAFCEMYVIHVGLGDVLVFGEDGLGLACFWEKTF